MGKRQFETAPLDDPEAALERALIDEYLHDHGTDAASVHRLPPDLARKLLTDAIAFAAAKLAEVAARAHYIHELHGK